jgi:ABC-type cobalamin/Fe3+-siderophores transport system ATPase subunit
MILLRGEVLAQGTPKDVLDVAVIRDGFGVGNRSSYFADLHQRGNQTDVEERHKRHAEDSVGTFAALAERE